MRSPRLRFALGLLVGGLGCREPAPEPVEVARPAANESEVVQSPEPYDDTPHYDLESMYGGGGRTGPLVRLCGLEIPVDAEHLHCELLPDDDPRALARLTSLRSLAVFRAPDPIDGHVLVESIASLPELIDLHLGPFVQVVSLRALARVSSLRSLTLVKPPEQVIPSLAGLQQLEELQVHECAGTDYRPLAALTNLDKLVLMGSAIEELEQIVGLGDLIELNLAFTRVRELEPLQRMQFRVLDLSHTPVVDLGPLAQIKLSTLDLNHTEVTDISPLLGHPTLYRLNLRGLALDDDALARLRAARPELKISI